MRIHMTVAVVSSLALSSLVLGAQQRGEVTKVTAGDANATGTVRFTVEGVNPCGAVELDYGDGAAVVHATSKLPATISYEYTQVGEYVIQARGMGNCDGTAGTKVRVDRVRRQPAPTPTPTPKPPAPRPQPEDWTIEQFRLFDVNNDNMVSREEWPGARAEFVRVDRNGDNRISQGEFLNGDANGRGRGRGRAAADREGTSATVIVNSREDWIDTGLDVRRSDVLTVDATGTIHFANQSPATGPDGAAGRTAPAGAPMPREFIGALVGRVGRSAPFLVGSEYDGLRPPTDGPLFLRINDDVLNDNRGEFRVTIAVARARAR